MKFKIFILTGILIISGFFNLSVHSEILQNKDKYEVQVFGRDNDERNSFNKFHFVNYFYLHFVMPFKLYKHLSLNSRNKILKKVYNNLKENYQNQIIVNTFKPIGLIIRLKPYKVKNDKSIIIFTNFNTKLSKIVSIDSNPSNFYGKQYYIISDKLVPGKIFYKSDKVDEKISEFKQKHQYNKLADYLLFDTLTNNDKEIPGIIANGIKSSKSEFKKCLLNLTLMQFYLMNNAYKNVEIILSQIKKDMENIIDNKKKRYIKQSVEIMNDIFAGVKHIQ